MVDKKRGWLHRIDPSPTWRERRWECIPLTYHDHKRRAVIALGVGTAHSLVAPHHPIATVGAVIGYGAALRELFQLVKKQPN